MQLLAVITFVLVPSCELLLLIMLHEKATVKTTSAAISTNIGINDNSQRSLKNICDQVDICDHFKNKQSVDSENWQQSPKDWL